jgi:class 3 adenylate cyclase
VRNALARFSQVGFEDDAARERARTRLLNAAKKYGLVPVGFITGQLQSAQRDAAAGRLVIELGREGAPGELEQRLRRVLRDPTLAVLHWSDAAGAYLDDAGRPASLPAEDGDRGVTLLERQGRPMTALVHDPKVLRDPALADTVLAAVRFVVEKERMLGEIQATSTDAAALPTGFVTLLMSDIQRSTALLRQLGDRYGKLLNDVRGILRSAVSRAGGREIDARADELFAVFERAPAAVEAAVAIQRTLSRKSWPDKVDVRVRIGIHSGHPTLTDVGYIGLAVHTTARVCAAARGGQILLSDETRAALRGAAPAGVRLRSVGRRRLPGLPKSQMLSQVMHSGTRPPRVSSSRGRSPSPRSPSFRRPSRRTR